MVCVEFKVFVNLVNVNGMRLLLFIDYIRDWNLDESFGGVEFGLINYGGVD